MREEGQGIRRAQQTAVVLDAPEIVPLGFKVLLRAWAVFATTALVLHIAGIPYTYGLYAATYVTMVIAAAPLVLWLLSPILYGRFGNLNAVGMPLQILYGAIFFTVVVAPFRAVVPGLRGFAFMAVVWLLAIFFPAIAQVVSGRRIWRGLLVRNSARPIKTAKAVTAAPAHESPADFALVLGSSTGHFAQLGHGAAPAAGQELKLNIFDAATNIITFGGIGSGKTTRLINPLLLQVLQQDAGALIFDIKTDFIKETKYLARIAGRRVQIIGDGGLSFNLLEGLTPEVAASFLKSAFLVAEGGKPSGNAFWIDGAVELCRNALGLLQFFPERYTLPELNRFIFDSDVQTEVFEELERRMAYQQLDDSQRRMVEANRYYFAKLWEPKEDKEKNYIRSTCAQVLAPFTNPALVDAFCTVGSPFQQASLEDLVNLGAVFLVEIPMTRYGKEGAAIAYLFIKLRFMQVMKERRMHADWDQRRPVAFVCDEYQAIIDEISDTDFWDKSRSAKTIGIISMQGYSSMINALGSEDKARTIMQNFRQMVCFRTEDEKTLRRIETLLGQVDVAKVGESKGASTNYSAGGDTSGTSSTRSVSWQRQSVVNPQLFRQLGPSQAVAILNINGHAYDDVINCNQIIVPDEVEA